LSDAERERLRTIEVALDQCSGADPSEAIARPEAVVEGYEQ
jgi:hypothetical protein